MDDALLAVDDNLLVYEAVEWVRDLVALATKLDLGADDAGEDCANLILRQISLHRLGHFARAIPAPRVLDTEVLERVDGRLN